MKSKKSKKIGSIVVLILALGFVGYALGFFGKRLTPMQMLASSFSEKQYYVDKTLTIVLDLKKKKTSLDEKYSDLGNLTFDISQNTDNSDLLNSKAKISVDGYVLADDSGSPFSKLDFAGDFVMANKVFYARATKLPMVPFFDPAKVKDIWWSIDPVSLAQKFGGEDKAKEIQKYFDGTFSKTEEDAKAMSEIFEKDNFVVNPKFIGEEKVNGRTVRDITFTIDKKILADFVYDMSVYENKKKDDKAVADDVLAKSKDDVVKMLDNATITPIAVGVYTDDNRLYKIDANVDIKDPAYNPADQAAFEVMNVGFSAKMDYSPVAQIEVPSDSQPIEKLLSQIFGDMFSSAVKKHSAK